MYTVTQKIVLYSPTPIRGAGCDLIPLDFYCRGSTNRPSNMKKKGYKPAHRAQAPEGLHSREVT